MQVRHLVCTLVALLVIVSCKETTKPPSPYTLTVAGTGDGNGTVTASAAGGQAALSCTITQGVTSGACSGTYPGATLVTLTATPSTGSSFGSWSGVCALATGASCIVGNISGTYTGTATFINVGSYTLTVAGTGDGNGTVTASAAGGQAALSCTITQGVTSGVCSGIYPSATLVTLTAAPSTGSSFGSWSGVCAGATGSTCIVGNIQGTYTGTSTFTNVGSYTLTVAGTGDGNGTVTAPAAGGQAALNCTITQGVTSGACSATYPSATLVTLTAAPKTASGFRSWSGVCAGAAGATCTVGNILGANTATATFVSVDLYTLTVAGTGTGNGTVTAPAAGGQAALNCTITQGVTSGACSATYPGATLVTLTAMPSTGSSFGSWSGVCALATGASCIVGNITSSNTATASFAALQGLVALYPLDGDGTDASGNGNNGTVIGAVAATGHTGQASTALLFSGTAYDSVPTNPILKALTADMTVVFWVKRSTTQIVSSIIPISRRVYGDTIHFELYSQPGGFGFECCSSGGSTTGTFYAPSGTGLSTINDGQWHQVAVTRRFGASGFTQLYQDGVLIQGTYTSGSATAAAPVIDAPLLIGLQASTSPGQFTGYLDNIYIFNRVLTQAEIQALP